MYEFTKRVFDVVVALVLLLVLLPLLLPLVLILKLTDEGEVFYFQDRVGFQNRKFSIWKFATMLKDSPNMSGGEITLRNDPRITTAGKFLRLTKLNELPQLVNVLIGDMSFVGPRPLMPVSFEQYAPEVQERVYESRPGITGIGSVIFRDEEKLVTDSGMDPRAFYRDYVFTYKGALEMWYQDHKSLYVDLMLIILTAWVIFFPESALAYRVFPDLPQRPGALSPSPTGSN
ncbi:MAG: sugar transferase [Rhodothermales bacterium]|nr:sugar transferase [Rhodothermales bacterium]